MKISLCIPFHLRGERKNECLKKTFQHYEVLAGKLLIDELIFCGSEGALSYGFYEDILTDDLPFCFGDYIEVPQGAVTISSAGDDVLRKKFNDSLATLPKSDWYCLAGANDIVNEDFFWKLKDTDPQGVKMAGVSIEKPLFCLDELTAWTAYKFRVRYNTFPFKLNPGINCFSHDAMVACDFKPYSQKGCETGAEIMFTKLGEIVPLDGTVVMMKGTTDLNPIRKIVAKHKRLDISPKEMEYLRSIL